MAKRPVPSVAAIIIENDCILLIRRGREPSKGKWSIPGGRVEWGEPLIDAVKREVLEETGLQIEVENVAGVYDLIIPAGDEIEYHYVIIDYYATNVGGELAADDDASEARWVPITELESCDLAEHLRERLVDMHLAS
ncbi:MAG: NUDIX hydrolase [Armatimonadota bacterium]